VTKIQLFYENIQPLKTNKTFIKNQISRVILSEKKLVGNLSVIFCSDYYLLEMNKQYLGHNYFTDVITFDFVEETVISGDIFISIDRIRDNARLYDSPVIHELFRVIFHGVLHLIGYNDKTDDEIKLMREKENFYLQDVDFKGLKI
jgi:rRNA maturation RNase YbeY